MNTTVYRVEHARYGHGPYVGSQMSDDACIELSNRLDMDCNLSTHPTPQSDEIGDMEKWEYCGFDSLESLLDWFDQWAEELWDAGYIIQVYCGPEDLVRKGRKQVVFKKDKFEKVSTITLEREVEPCQWSLNDVVGSRVLDHCKAAFAPSLS